MARNHEFLYNKTVDYFFINYFCTFCVNILCNNILFMYKNYRPSIFSVLLQLKDLILLKELNWLPLQSRITYHVALLVFKIHNDLAPNYLKTILLFTSNSRYTASSIAWWYSAGFECRRSQVQSPVKDRVIPKTL